MATNKALDVAEVIQNGFEPYHIKDVSITSSFVGGELRHTVTIPNLSRTELERIVALIGKGSVAR